MRTFALDNGRKRRRLYPLRAVFFFVANLPPTSAPSYLRVATPPRVSESNRPARLRDINRQVITGTLLHRADTGYKLQGGIEPPSSEYKSAALPTKLLERVRFPLRLSHPRLLHTAPLRSDSNRPRGSFQEGIVILCVVIRCAHIIRALPGIWWRFRTTLIYTERIKSRMRTLTSRTGTSAPSKSDLLELPGGGEPPSAEYESAVLPLNYGSISPPRLALSPTLVRRG